MTAKADFNAEEWRTLVYAEARRHQGGSELLDAIVSFPRTLDVSLVAGKATPEGIGGKPVSANERAALDAIRAALGQP